jgi:hypothetical protein
MTDRHVYLVCRVDVSDRGASSTVVEVWDNRASALTRMNQLAHADAEMTKKGVPSGKTRVKPYNDRSAVTIEKWAKVPHQQNQGRWVSLRDYTVRSHKLLTNVVDRLAELAD